MPGLLPMRSIGVASKARSGSARNLARAKADNGREESAAGATALVRVPSWGVNLNTMGLLSTQLQARSKVPEVGAENSRSKIFGNGVDLENRFGSQYVSSSGSEHEVSSLGLGAMVDGLIENDSSDDGHFPWSHRCNCSSMCDCSDLEDSRSSLGGELSEILQELVSSTNVTERILLSEVNKAKSKEDGGGGRRCLMRQVMKYLRTSGYNAAICKSRWDHAGSFPGGDYNYIDVVFESPTGKIERVLIDVDFQAQFEIARPTACYNAAVQVLPTVFVGRADRLLQIVNIMSDGVRLSLKKQGMHLPPWRKPEYLRSKWFSMYRRTTNDAIAHKTNDQDEPNVSCIALRDNGWNSNYTEEIEVDYLSGGERPTMKDVKNLVGKKLTEVSNKPSGNVGIKPIVDNSGWTLPTFKPRVFPRPGQTRLASILREAGLTSSMQTLIEG